MTARAELLSVFGSALTLILSLSRRQAPDQTRKKNTALLSPVDMFPCMLVLTSWRISSLTKSPFSNVLHFLRRKDMFIWREPEIVKELLYNEILHGLVGLLRISHFWLHVRNIKSPYSPHTILFYLSTENLIVNQESITRLNFFFSHHLLGSKCNDTMRGN